MHFGYQVSEPLVTAKLQQLLKRTNDWRTPHQVWWLGSPSSHQRLAWR
jgi:hypothetical protein